jgi:nucleolar complex protein 2
VLAIQESTKLLPWIISARKTMRAYLKVLLELWSSAPNDSVRIAAFLAVRRMSEGGDDAIKDQCLKVCSNHSEPEMHAA